MLLVRMEKKQANYLPLQPSRVWVGAQKHQQKEQHSGLLRAGCGGKRKWGLDGQEAHLISCINKRDEPLDYYMLARQVGTYQSGGKKNQP